MLNQLIQFTLLGLLVGGELLQIKNNSKDDLLVSVTGLKDLVVRPGKIVPVTVPEEFTGTITGIPKRLKKAKVPRTTIELTLSPMAMVSVLDGFNIKAKITPLQGRRCKPAACSVDINSLCSPRNQVKNNRGAVLGCHNSPFLFKVVCPNAVVTTADVRNVFTCTTDSYLITLG
ncbi:thaumatin-like protein 1 [Anoplophora glabripennis]|uniref:thaumatin-like protein 1 n=1 Tax=Anoplophora glabripennis TaxID=217634 RepID=UPI000873BB68|nr:thaumatin-like protein 1 [Anoplophora glabripennis]